MYGPPEEDDEEYEIENEEEDIDGMVIHSSSNPTEQTTQKAEEGTVYEDLPTSIPIPEPIETDYDDFEQIFYDSEEEFKKKTKRRKSKSKLL